MAKRFPIYKGLQKPLVFKGFKGKFIYWGVGFLLAGLVSGSITMALVNMYVGVIVLVAVMAGGLFYTAGKQKGGLNSKSRNKDVYIHQANLKKINTYGRKTSI